MHNITKQLQVISGTDSYEKSLQEESFQLDARIEKGNGTLSYRSLDETVVTTDPYESASMRIEITITDSGSSEEPREDIAAVRMATFVFTIP